MTRLDPATVEACAKVAEERLEHWKKRCAVYIDDLKAPPLYDMGARAEAATILERIRSLLPTPGEPACGTCSGTRVAMLTDAYGMTSSQRCPDCGAQPVALRLRGKIVSRETWRMRGIDCETTLNEIEALQDDLSAALAARHMGERR